MTIEQLCGHVIRLIHTMIHVYGSSGELLHVYTDHGEQADILASDPPFGQKLLERQNPEHPVLYFEGGQIVYGIVTAPERVYVIGPCCTGGDSRRAVCFLKEHHRIAADSSCGIYTLPLMDFTEIVIMVYEMVTGQTINVSELWMKNFINDTTHLSVQKKLQHVFYLNQEQEMVHNPYSQEQREQDGIRTGNLEALYRSFQETYVGQLGTLANDSLRNEKDMSIVLVTLASRSAIEGGILPETAYSMSDAYIQRIEELNQEGEALALARQAEIEFCCLVRDNMDQKVQNPMVVRCKELILKYLHTKITVGDLARELEINANYLSQLFAKEEGMTLSDYIAKEKIRFAKQQLIYTDDSYEAIAYSYAFVSQSHFGRVFKKWTGMTPGQYRAGHGKTNK